MNINPATLVVILEQPFKDAVSLPNTDIRASLIMGLGCDTNYWVELALNWIEEGFPLDAEIVGMLEVIFSKKNLSQKTRHRAFAFAKRWNRANKNI